VFPRVSEIVKKTLPHDALPPGAVSTDLGTIERETIAEVLRECRWNQTRAAKRLGVTRTQLYLRLQKYGLEKPPEV
jgi:transcriptional regulator of acetoin/glycerol metabolism